MSQSIMSKTSKEWKADRRPRGWGLGGQRSLEEWLTGWIEVNKFPEEPVG